MWRLILLSSILLLHSALTGQNKVYYVGHSLVNLNMPYITDSMAHYKGISNADYRHHINIGTALQPNWIDSNRWNGDNIWDPTLGMDVEHGSNHMAELRNTYNKIVITERVPIRQNDYDSTIKYARLFYNYARTHSPSIRRHYYATWEPKITTWQDWRDTLAVLVPYYEAMVDNIKTSSSDSIFIVPANLAFIALYDTLQQRGSIGSINSMDALFLDDGIHASDTGNYFVACVMLACVYGQNPIGLPSIKAGPYTNDIVINDAVLRAKLQEIAWNISCQYTRSGLNCGTSLIKPTFSIPARICSGEDFQLPTTSTNGITGTWTPTKSVSNTTRYTFTPNTGQGADTTSYFVTVWPIVKPNLSSIHRWICPDGDISHPLVLAPTIDAPHLYNRITGAWTPPKNNIATTTYTFTPAPNQCSDTAMMTVVVHPLPNITISITDSTLTATAGLANYEWDLAGTILSGANTNIYIATQSGIYRVRARNEYCYNTATINYTHPTAGASIQSGHSSWQVFPNPIVNHRVQIISDKRTEYTISDALRRILSRGKLEIGRNEIDLAKIHSSTCYLTINEKTIQLINHH